MSGSHIRYWPLIRHLTARPHLASGAALAVVVSLVLPHLWPLHPVASHLIAYNAGVGFYLILAAAMMRRSTPEHLRRRAKAQDDGRFAVLVAVVVAAVASLVAIATLLSVAKWLQGLPKITHVSLAAGTVLTSWAFTQVMFALHYAHEFYLEKKGSSEPVGGLAFPGTTHPTYVDFLYFSCVIGTSGQTADISFVSAEMRKIGLVHCVLAFFFNATLMALTINVAAGLI